MAYDTARPPRVGQRDNPSLATVVGTELACSKRGFVPWYHLLAPVVITVPLFLGALGSSEAKAGQTFEVFRQGSLAELKSSLDSSRIVVSCADDEAAARQLRAAGFDPLIEPGGVAVHCADPEARIAEVVRALDVPGLTVAVRHPSMNDVYLAAASGPESHDRQESVSTP